MKVEWEIHMAEFQPKAQMAIVWAYQESLPSQPWVYLSCLKFRAWNESFLSSKFYCRKVLIYVKCSSWDLGQQGLGWEPWKVDGGQCKDTWENANNKLLILLRPSKFSGKLYTFGHLNLLCCSPQYRWVSELSWLFSGSTRVAYSYLYYGNSHGLW